MSPQKTPWLFNDKMHRNGEVIEFVGIISRGFLLPFSLLFLSAPTLAFNVCNQDRCLGIRSFFPQFPCWLREQSIGNWEICVIMLIDPSPVSCCRGTVPPSKHNPPPPIVIAHQKNITSPIFCVGHSMRSRSS